MSTYLNCYEIVSQVRQGLNEFGEALTKGTVEGAYSNDHIVSKINSTQRFIHGLLAKRAPEQFLASTTISGVDSVYALPWDFGSLIEFKDENGRKVFPLTVSQFKLDAATGSDSFYYKKGNNLVLDKDSVTETYTLWYYTKPRDLDYGKATAGGATSITLATSAKKIADYYNGMIIENVTKDWVDTISDYTAARVATIGIETGAANDYYGLVSELPEPFHFLISIRAILEFKFESPIVQNRPTNVEIGFFMDQLNIALGSFGDSTGDIDIEELFLDYEPAGAVSGGIIATD